MKRAAAVLLGMALCAVATAGHARVFLRNPQAQQDWTARSTASGVVLAIKFDKAPASLGWATSTYMVLPVIPSSSTYWGTSCGTKAHYDVVPYGGGSAYTCGTHYSVTDLGDGSIRLDRITGIPANSEVQVNITVADGLDALAIWKWRQQDGNTQADLITIDTSIKTSGTGSMKMIAPPDSIGSGANNLHTEMVLAFTGPPLYPWKGPGLNAVSETYTFPTRFKACTASNRVFPAANSTTRQTDKPCDFWIQLRRRFDANYVRPRLGVILNTDFWTTANLSTMNGLPNAVAYVTAATYTPGSPGYITLTLDRNIGTSVLGGDLTYPYTFSVVYGSGAGTSDYNFPGNFGRDMRSAIDSGGGVVTQITFEAPWIVGTPTYSCGGSPTYTNCALLVTAPLGWKLSFLTDGSTRWPNESDPASTAVKWDSSMSRTTITGASFYIAASDVTRLNNHHGGPISFYCSGTGSTYLKLPDQLCNRTLPDASHYYQWPNLAGGTAGAIGQFGAPKLGYGAAGAAPYQPWHESLTTPGYAAGLVSLADRWTTWMYHITIGHFDRGNVHGYPSIAVVGAGAQSSDYGQDSTYVLPYRNLYVTGNAAASTYTLLHLTGSGITTTGNGTATVDDGSQILDGNYYMVGGEILRIVSHTGNTITFDARGQYGTTAATHAANIGVQLALPVLMGSSSLTTTSGNEFFDMRLAVNDVIWISGKGAYTVTELPDAITMKLTPIGTAPAIVDGAATLIVNGAAEATSNLTGTSCTTGQWKVTFKTTYPASDPDILAGAAYDDPDPHSAITTVYMTNESQSATFLLRSLVSSGVFCADISGSPTSPFTASVGAPGGFQAVKRDWRDGIMDVYISPDGASTPHLINRIDVGGAFTYPHGFTWAAYDNLHAAGFGRMDLSAYQQYEMDKTGATCAAQTAASLPCFTGELLHDVANTWFDEIIISTQQPAMPTPATGP